MNDKKKSILKLVLFQVAIPLLVLGALISFDQLTKLYIDKNYELNGPRKDFIKDFFGFAYVRNTGASFSMLAGKDWGQTFFQIITPIALVGYVVLYFFVGRKRWFLRYGIVLTTAGTIGNYIDRLAYSYVIDFLSFSFFDLDYAIFNFADIFLCVGIGVILVHYFFLDDDAIFKFKKKEEKSPVQPETEVGNDG